MDVRRFLMVLVCVAAVAGLAACTTINVPEDQAGAPEAPELVAATEAPTPTTAQAPAPATDQCEVLDERSDGVYAVSDAGEVRVLRDGNAVTLEDVQAAQGWTPRVDEQDFDEVNVDFHRGVVEFEFEADLDDGHYEITVCQDS